MSLYLLTTTEMSVIINLLSVYINAYKCELKAPSPVTGGGGGLQSQDNTVHLIFYKLTEFEKNNFSLQS